MRARAGVGALAGSRLDDQVDVDLEVAGADRHLDAVPVAPRLGERRRDGRLAGAEEAQDAAARARSPASSTRAERRRLERARPEPLQLAGRPGQHDDDASLPLSRTRPGAVPAMPSTIAPSGSVACLRTPAAKSAYGRPQPLGEPRARSPSISASSAGVDHERRAGDARDELDVRSSWVGPSPPETRHTSASSPRAAPPRARPDRRRRSDPRRAGGRARSACLRVERAVQVGSLARARARCP